MAVKAKKRKPGGHSKAKISSQGPEWEETAREDTELVDYPTDGEPHSEVRVGFGLKVSKPGTYSSAAFEVEVMVPCEPGKEDEAGEYAVGKVRDIFAKHDDEFQETVDSL